jgi:hypothetical protein
MKRFLSNLFFAAWWALTFSAALSLGPGTALAQSFPLGANLAWNNGALGVTGPFSPTSLTSGKILIGAGASAITPIGTPTLCPSGQAPRGIDDTGAATGCQVIPTDTDTTIKDLHSFYVPAFTGSATVYVRDGCTSGTIGLCSLRATGALNIDDVNCIYVNSSTGAAQDPGNSTTIVITLHRGATGSLSAASSACTITGNGSTGTNCTNTTDESVSAGNEHVFAITKTGSITSGDLKCSYVNKFAS